MSDITRRDFLNGVAIGVAGIWAGACDWGAVPAEAQNAPGYYPPSLMGMRGSHDGSYAIAHALRDGTFWKTAGQPVSTGESYDLVVVGAGISGLAAAHYYRARAGNNARILILDNHDDFGGHAKRNEFRVGGRLLLANGGTQSIESPFPYSTQSRALMMDLGIDPAALEAKCDHPHRYDGLEGAAFFDKETFGVDRLVVGLPGRGGDGERAVTSPTWAAFAAQTPLSTQAQHDLVRLWESTADHMPGVSPAEKKDRLTHMSYRDFLTKVLGMHEEIVKFMQKATHGLYGIGIDAVPALDCWAIGFPGFRGLNLDKNGPGGRLSYTARGSFSDEYDFHFPDGNASVARALVRSLIPPAMPGKTAEDLVTAPVDYSKLDAGPVRLRLSSTVLRVRHSSPSEAEVTYGRDAKAYTVRAKSVVMACWNMMIPYVVDELPAEQKTALHYGVKVPLVYTQVALRNWTAFQKLGMHRVTTPGMYHSSMTLSEPIDIGAYTTAHTPDEPIVLHMLRTPCQPGLSAREQQRAGHAELLATPFSTFEHNIRDQLGRVLGGGGFDADHDITGITVNRWPHGYAYEYNPLWDPDWPSGQSPCEIGRRRHGRIAIANSDAAAAAYTDVAIDQGYRAIDELLSG
ncbi:MAG TPA: NAD(P)-binding protein [Gemmatimonadaceae bacterium]|nr:NAD(P)-binding protein [Gemmatimonadaceae bacterium]